MVAEMYFLPNHDDEVLLEQDLGEGHIIAPRRGGGFDSLKEATFKWTQLSEEDLANLFSVCPHLEHLRLHRLYKDVKVTNLLTLSVDDISINVYDHRLEISPVDDISINVYATNLLTLSVKSNHEIESPHKYPRLDLFDFNGQVFSSSKKGTPSQLTHIRIHHCLFQRSNYAAFPSLTVLELDPTQLRDRDIWNLMSHCTKLERFSIGHGGSRFNHFKIPFPSHPLKYVELKDNEYLEKIEICSKNLVYFDLYTEHHVPLIVKEAPKLVRCSIGTVDEKSKMISVIEQPPPLLIKQLESLTLFLNPLQLDKEAIISARLPDFKKLKQLDIKFQCGSLFESSLFRMASLLKAAPELRNLQVHMPCYHSYWKHTPDEIQGLPQFAHKRLKEVKISGFWGNPCELEIAAYLSKYATSLELMEIETHTLVYQGDGNWVHIPSHLPLKEADVFGRV